LVTLYITSSEAGAGRTTVCAGVGKCLLDDGKKVGFLKPTITDVENPPKEIADSDPVFMKSIFALEEPVDRLCPVISDGSNLGNKVKEASSSVAAGKDVLIVEGICESGIAEALGARVIIIEDYSSQLSEAKLINTCQKFGKYLLGVVLNKVPRSKLEQVRNGRPAQFAKAGINVLGVLPEDRVLLTLTIGELAEHLQGKILNCAEKSTELVENFMLGAMTVDSGPEYFGRRANKAVVVRSGRPDMQLAALETSTRCLILSGNEEPTRTVLYGAEDKGIPVILAEGDTAAIVTGIEDALGKARFNQEKKLSELIEIMEQHFDFQAVYKGLGIAS